MFKIFLGETYFALIFNSDTMFRCKFYSIVFKKWHSRATFILVINCLWARMIDRSSYDQGCRLSKRALYNLVPSHTLDIVSTLLTVTQPMLWVCRMLDGLIDLLDWSTFDSRGIYWLNVYALSVRYYLHYYRCDVGVVV